MGYGRRKRALKSSTSQTIFPWLKAFLAHANAHGTLPDVLSWHVTMVGANASELEGQHAALKAWAKSEGIPLPPMAHNEIVGPSESLSPAANLAFLSTLERLQAEHSCRACWTDAARQNPFASCPTPRALLTPQVQPGSLYRCGKSAF